MLHRQSPIRVAAEAAELSWKRDSEPSVPDDLDFTDGLSPARQWTFAMPVWTFPMGRYPVCWRNSGFPQDFSDTY